MWDKRAEYLHNVDGGTVKMILDQGFGDTKLVTIGLLGIYAPGLDEKGGLECKAFVQEWFENNTSAKTRWNFIVTTSKLDEDRFVAVVANQKNEFTLNALVAEFIHTNGYGGGSGA